MELRKTIKNLRNEVAFKIYNASDEFRDSAVLRTRDFEQRVVDKIMSYLPLPSKGLEIIHSMIYGMADALTSLCEKCEMAPCACEMKEELRKMKEESLDEDIQALERAFIEEYNNFGLAVCDLALRGGREYDRFVFSDEENEELLSMTQEEARERCSEIIRKREEMY